MPKIDGGCSGVVRMTPERAIDIVAKTIGYDPPIDGLLGSGLSRMMAYDRAARILDALGIPRELSAETVRRQEWPGEAIDGAGGSAPDG